MRRWDLPHPCATHPVFGDAPTLSRGCVGTEPCAAIQGLGDLLAAHSCQLSLLRQQAAARAAPVQQVPDSDTLAGVSDTHPSRGGRKRRSIEDWRSQAEAFSWHTTTPPSSAATRQPRASRVEAESQLTYERATIGTLMEQNAQLQMAMVRALSEAAKREPPPPPPPPPTQAPPPQPPYAAEPARAWKDGMRASEGVRGRNAADDERSGASDAASTTSAARSEPRAKKQGDEAPSSPASECGLSLSSSRNSRLSSSPTGLQAPARRLRIAGMCVLFPLLLRRHCSDLSGERQYLTGSAVSAYEGHLAGIEASLKKAAYIPMFWFYRNPREPLDFLRKNVGQKGVFAKWFGASLEPAPGEWVGEDRLVRLRARLLALLGSLQWFLPEQGLAQPEDSRRRARHLHFLQSATYSNGAFIPVSGGEGGDDGAFLLHCEAQWLAATATGLHVLNLAQRKMLILCLFLVRFLAFKVVIGDEAAKRAAQGQPILRRNVALVASLLVLVCAHALDDLGFPGAYEGVFAHEGAALGLLSMHEILLYAAPLRQDLQEWKRGVAEWSTRMCSLTHHSECWATHRDEEEAPLSPQPAKEGAEHPSYLLFDVAAYTRIADGFSGDVLAVRQLLKRRTSVARLL